MIIPEIYDKVWVAVLDDHTRTAHRHAHGQRAPFSGTFDVGGEDLRYPGDPLGTPENTYNCRCHIRIEQRGSLTADGGFVAPSEQEYAMQRTTLIPEQTETLVADGMQPDITDVETYRTFTDQAFAVIGSPTGDARMFSSDVDFSFRTFPLPLMWCEQTGEGHERAYTIGVIEDARVEGTDVLASGYLLNTADSQRWYEIAAHGVSNVSLDFISGMFFYGDEHGAALDEEQLLGRLESGDPIVKVYNKAHCIGATFVATPAFDTRLALNSERESRDVALVASAAVAFAPRVYDHRLFENPNLSGPTLPTVGEDGRIYGHLAVFNQCHRSIQHECVLVPRSPSDYSHFHTSPALCLDDGSRLPVGRLTVGTGHADPRLSGGPALAHYDDTGSCFALVRVGEDSHGVWFSGVAAPWATAEQVEMGVSAPLSGDWRDFGQGLELIAALAVNTPGFAARGRDDDQGRPVALVASLGPPPSTRRGGMNLTRAELKATLAEVLHEEHERAELELARTVALARAAEHTRPLTPGEQVEKILARLK